MYSNRHLSNRYCCLFASKLASKQTAVSVWLLYVQAASKQTAVSVWLLYVQAASKQTAVSV